MAIMEISVVPIGTKTPSLSRYVAGAIDIIKEEQNIKYQLTPMGTILEAGSLDTIFEAVKVAHEALVTEGIMRIESTLKIDDRRDKAQTMREKVTSVEKYF